MEKAFLMVSVKEADRDVLHFIWTDDVLKDPPATDSLVSFLVFRQAHFY